MIGLSVAGLLGLVSYIAFRALLRDKPFTEDEGNWYYAATFWSKGTRPCTLEGRPSGFFNIPLMASVWCRLLRRNDLQSLQSFKAFWYALDTVTIFWLAWVLWQSLAVAAAGALLFVAIMFLPRLAFSHTYAEHFYIAPINTALVFGFYGMHSGDTGWLFWSGVMAAWAFQIKVPALLFAVACPFLIGAGIKGSAAYLAGFLVLTLLPLPLLLRYPRQVVLEYFIRLFGPVLVLGHIVLERAGIRILGPLLAKMRGRGSGENYIRTIRSREAAGRVRALVRALQPLRIFILLALVQPVTLFFGYDTGVVLSSWLVLIYLAIYYLPRNLNLPYLNMVWAPLALLAGKTVVEVFVSLPAPAAVASVVVIGGGLFGYGFDLVESIRNKEGQGRSSQFARVAATIGENIRKLSSEEENLFVWGGHPALYLYAGRQAYDTCLLFTVMPDGQADTGNTRFIESRLKQRAPDLVFFFHYHNPSDGWDIERIQKLTGCVYRPVHSFQVTAGTGVMVFPLYRRVAPVSLPVNTQNSSRSILIVTHNIFPLRSAGVEIYVYDFCRELVRRGWTVSVAMPAVDEQVAAPRIKRVNNQAFEGFAVYALTVPQAYDKKFCLRHLQLEELFLTLIKQKKPDTVHVQHLIGWPLSIVELAAKAGYPQYMTLHDFWMMCPLVHLYREKTRDVCGGPLSADGCAFCMAPAADVAAHAQYRERLQLRRDYGMRLLNEHVRRATAPARFVADMFKRCGYRADIEVSPLGIQPLERAAFDGQRPLTFGFFSTLSRLKNIDTLVTAFKRVKADARLLIYGKESTIKITQLQELIAGDERISYGGEFSPADLSRMFSQVDVFVMPSVHESYSRVIREAFLAGVPVLASAVGAIPEIVEHEKNGLLFDPHDVNDMAAAIERVCREPGLLDVFRKNIPPVLSVEEDVAGWETRYTSP